ncbi:MAG: DnaJ domain-containing protein [Campylobacteraceae bacterium]|nr:DnaJ domain-containing protein [Campylobacteraceae bacterium]
MNNFQYALNRFIKTGITLFLLYLIFTNFLAFIGVIFFIGVLFYFLVYKRLKKMSKGFKFQFNQADFQNANFHQGGHQSSFSQKPQMDEVQKAKNFFSFTHDPTKEDIKKKYKELARKYHPDINDHGDELMKELNHHKDVLMQTFA